MSQLPAQPASPDPDASPRPDAPPDGDGVAPPAAPASRRRGAARWAIAGCAALLVAAVTAGAMQLGGAASTPAPDTAPASVQAAAADAPVAPIAFTVTPPAQAPVSFDPLVRFARFGTLPAGMVPRTTLVQAGEQGGYTIEAGLPERSIGAQVAVTFFPRGVTPHRECSAAANLVRPPSGSRPTPTADLAAPAVQGKPAKLVDGRLRWEYAPGAWAEAIGKDLVDRAGDDTPAGLRALAGIVGDLRYGIESLRFPLVVGGVPQDLHLAAASVTERSKTGWSSVLMFTAGPYCAGSTTPQSTLGVRAEAIIPGYGWTGDRSNTTVDGRRAVKQESPTGATDLAVYGDPGPFVAVSSTDAATTQLVGGDGLVGLYRRIQVLGTTDLTTIAQPADQTPWTTDPIR
ncbi:hypothetical protein [Catellatospora vulcania]|uniref:hypothetical protein n=1 Tax=Catellatospora vulcania TaxID=1460450 RepID=UPI0012D3EDAB|nr:hypothetical protein [Catellatospora vulcania]